MRLSVGDSCDCDCGGDRSFSLCCGPIIARQASASTAEELMRSRYTAFCRVDAHYLTYSWDPETRPRRVHASAGTRWTGLRVVSTEDGGPLDSIGMVEFVALYSDASGPSVLRERSRFRRHEGRWVYIDGEQTTGD